MALPFLWETRVAIDWTFTPDTSLSLIMWFKLEDVYSGLTPHGCIYMYRCDP